MDDPSSEQSYSNQYQMLQAEDEDPADEPEPMENEERRKSTPKEHESRAPEERKSRGMTTGVSVEASDSTRAPEPDYIFGSILTQMTATAGIKKHGQKAIDALYKELSLLDSKAVFSLKKADNLSGPQKKAALRAINLIKEKRDGALKGQSCADGSSQRSLYTKEESVSSTVSNDSLMLSLMIDPMGRQGRSHGRRRWRVFVG